MDCPLDHLLKPQFFLTIYSYTHQSVSELHSLFHRMIFSFLQSYSIVLNYEVLQCILILGKGGLPHCLFLMVLFKLFLVLPIYLSDEL